MNPGTAVRVEAARVLARVALDGVSMRAAIGASAPRLADPRDRALLSASLFVATRWWLRFDAALGHLLERGLPQKAREVRCLLVLAMAQIEVMRMPEYAVVAACVDAVRELGLPRHAGLVNAVLRRYLRERTELLQTLDADEVTRHAHPAWLIERIRADWHSQADGILAANNREAALTLRVNRRCTDRDSLRARLIEAGIESTAPASLPDALLLTESTDVSRLPGFAEGAFSVQDGAAQRVVELLDLADGMRMLDACAAPGGKAAHALECADIDLLALDSDAARLPRIGENLQRLGLSAEIRQGDAGRLDSWWDGRAFDRILLDAPCSASGIIRRQPDIKLHRRAADLAPLANTQARLLDALWPALKPGGRLLYATCSVLRMENEAVLTGFLDQHADAKAGAVPERFGRPAGVGRQNLPGIDGMDGFYYAVVEKSL